MICLSGGALEWGPWRWESGGGYAGNIADATVGRTINDYDYVWGAASTGGRVWEFPPSTTP